MNIKYLLIVLIHSGVIFSQSHPAPKSYIAYKAIDSVTVDGKDDENSWQNVAWSANFVDIEGEIQPKFRTNFKIIWDEKYLFFYAKMEEPHIWATLKKRDTVIFYNNDFEIFIDPDGDTHNYYEFEMNAINTVWDLFLVKPYRDSGPIVQSWDIQGLKSAVHIEGTLNDALDVDNYWSVEIAIPWKVLKEANLHKNIPVHDFWRINFSRVNWDHDIINGKYSRKKDVKGNHLPEYNWVWSPQWIIDMHEPEKWGYVYFSSKNAGEKDKFSIPEDEKIKWIMYDLYRAQNPTNKYKNKEIPSVKKLLKEEIKINGELIEPLIEHHLTGWNISVESPFTGKRLIIKDDGEFIEK